MSQLGSISNKDKQLNIYNSNLTIDELTELKKLPSNAFIISSPVNVNNDNDKGTPAFAVTDYNCNLVQITHTMNSYFFKNQEDSGGNVITLNIDYLINTLANNAKFKNMIKNIIK